MSTITVEQLENEIMKEITYIMNNKITTSKPGSVKYLLFGPELSRQSISIKLGKIGELIPKIIITHSPNLDLLRCGVQCVNKTTQKNKDIDLIWKNDSIKTLYYREVKGNINLDSEKMPATIQKIKENINQKSCIGSKYSEYNIDTGLFHWSIYDRKDLKKNIPGISTCEKKGMKIEHMGDMMKLLKFNWTKKQYISFFHRVGEQINNMFKTSQTKIILKKKIFKKKIFKKKKFKKKKL